MSKNVRTHFEYDAVKQQAYMNDIRRSNEEHSLESGKSPKYKILTYGCQMNEHDSEKLIGMLGFMGYERTEKTAEADLIIYNTCCIRENAELRVHGNLSQLKRNLKKNPNLRIVVCGCMMQQPHVVEELKRRYPYISLIFGTHNLYNFPCLLANVLDHKGMVVEVWDDHGEIIEGLPVERRYDIKAYVNIMYGCNNFCSYCIVPYTRGREKSREAEDIVNEIKDLVGHGVKEVTLLGQNVNSYGKTLASPISFSTLLETINGIEGLERIRFMTSHPKDISDELIDVMARCEKVCEQLHLPVQSGSNKILKAMNRHYTRERYLEIAQMAREKIKNVAITTDLIIGFPGETEEDLELTADLVRQVGFDAAFTFMYSPRKGTPAADFPEQVPEKLKHKGFNEVLKIQNQHVIAQNMGMQDAVVEVLVEAVVTDKNGNATDRVMGRTRQYLAVKFPGSAELIGKLVHVKATNPRGFSLEGELVEVIR